MENKLFIIENFIDKHDIYKYNKKIINCPIRFSGEQYFIKDQNEKKIEVSNLFVDLQHDQSLFSDAHQVLNKIHLAIENTFKVHVEKELGIGITVLKAGHSMPLHVDKGYGSEEEEKEINYKTPSGFPSREISSVFYWNDDYDGGEISFPKQNIKIKPSSGLLIIFPSNRDFPHEVFPVKNGVRYVSTGFWYCSWK